MPTLIRLLVILLVLVGLAYGAMFVLVATVTPRDKQVTIRIPARDLVPSPQRQTLTPREIDTSRKPEAAPAPAPAVDPVSAPAIGDSPSIQTAPASQGDDVVTMQQGVE